MIGAERQYRQRNASLRTDALVALGAAAFVDFIHVVSGIGFLGAGVIMNVIMKKSRHARGLNMAAILWSSGAAAGDGHLAEAGLTATFELAGNTFPRKLIDRVPTDARARDAT